MFVLDKWTIEKLCSQLVFPRISANDYYSDEEYRLAQIELVKMGVGGFCVFVGSKDDTAKMLVELQRHSEIPLLFCADFEHGLPMRLTGGTEFPQAMALGRTLSTDNTYKIAQAIAREAKSIGIHWNLAPVCDINSNPKNPIINIRAFGECADIVSAHSTAYIKGLQDEKVIACAKHFPGHGDTDIDSHLEMPVLNHKEDRIFSLELKPFESAIQEGVRTIMAAHLAVPAFDNENLPASLSKKLITGLLRNKLQFNGLVITDALEMKSISSRYSSGESAVMAARAGADIILLPPNPIEAIEALTAEADRNEEFYNNISRAVRRLLKEKDWCGILTRKNENSINKDDFSEHERLALQAALEAIELRGKDSLIPLKEDEQVAGFAFLQSKGDSSEDIQPAVMFYKFLAQAIENDCDFAFVDEDISDKDIQAFKEGTAGADIIILAIFFRARAYHGSAVLSERMKTIIRELSAFKPTIAVLFGNPYIIEEIPADLFISTFSDSLPSIAAAILKLSGREMFGGE